MFVVTVEFSVKPLHTDAFLKAVALQARHSLEKEKGCRRFDVAVNSQKHGRVFLYELYTDEAAFNAHLETGHFKNFEAAVRDLLESKTVETWNMIA